MPVQLPPPPARPGPDRPSPVQGGMLAGLALTAAILLLGLGLLARWEFDDRAALQARAAQLLDAVTQEAHILLDRLHEQRLWDCSPASQRAIRRLLFGAHFFREVGTFDADGLLLCTSTDDVLGQPRAGTSRIHYAHSGLGYSTGVSLILGQDQPRSVTATVLRRDRFNLVLAPQAEAALRHGAATLIALDTEDGLQPLFPAAADATAAVRRLPVPASTGVVREAHWWRGQFALQQLAGMGDFVLFTRWHLGDVLRQQSTLAVAIVLIATLAGLVAHGTVTTWLTRLNSIDHRVRKLIGGDRIVCVYQPIVALASGRAVGCEVLMRLQDGDRLLYPEQVIPAVLRQRLGPELDSRVARRALAETDRHLPPCGPFRIALNVLPDSLSGEHVIATLGEAAAPLRARDIQIELELTEYSLPTDVVTQARNLARAGFGLSIDDFGTGYSSLALVRQLCPDYLKIDRSFVHEMEESAIRASLIPEIVQIARAVDARVVAEGIENQAQRDRLHALGVDYGQGHYFAPPMPIADFVAWLRAQDAAKVDAA